MKCPPQNYLPLIGGLLVLTSLGCGKAIQAPKLDPAVFPKAISKIEIVTNEVLTAFAEGRPKDADAPLHTIDKVLNSAKTLADVAGLSGDQKASLTGSLDSLMKGFGELHEPMHGEEFPEDFDFAPIKEKLESGLVSLRESLPAPIAEEVAKLVEKASAAAAAAASATKPSEEDSDEGAEGHDDSDHDGHDHDDEPSAEDAS